MEVASWKPLVLNRKIETAISVFIIFLALYAIRNTLYAFAQDWKETSSDHFIVFYGGEEKFAKEVLHKAEGYYKRIASELGYPRYSEFWTWDKRVKIYIHPGHESFLRATGQPKWSQGVADYKRKEIISYAWSKNFTEQLLPHEMAHLIFRDFVGFRGEVPLWLDEGVAQWAEEPKREQVKAVIKKLYDDDALLSITDMMNLDIRKITENDKVYIRATRTKEDEPGVLFLSGDNLVSTYYMQAVSLVSFLIESFGSMSFADFCRELRDGKSFESALRAAYPSHVRNLAEFELKWRQYISR